MLVFKVYRGDEFLRDLMLRWERISVGSSDAAMLRLPGPGVKPEHATVSEREGEFRISACGPDAAVDLNGTPVAPGTEPAVKPGDVIRIGEYRIAVAEIEEGGDAAPGAGAGECLSRAKVLRELQIADTTLNRMIEAGELKVRHRSGSDAFERDQIFRLRENIQANTTRKLEKLRADGACAMLRFDEVLAILDVDAKTLNDLVSSGRLRAFRADNEIMFRGEDVSTLLKRGLDARSSPADDGMIIDDVSTGAVQDSDSEDPDLDDEETSETSDEDSRAEMAHDVGLCEGTREADRRKSAVLSVHYFKRMTPLRNFPLYVQARTREPLRLVPILPGCICVPPEVEIKPDSDKAEIWITPLSVGPCPAPVVHVFASGKPAGRIPVPFTCARLVYSWAFLLLSPAWVLLGLVLDALLVPQDSPPALLAAALEGVNGAANLGMGLFIISFSLGVLLFFLSKPAAAPVVTCKLEWL